MIKSQTVFKKERLRTQSQLFSLWSYEWGSKRPMRARPSWVAQLNMGGVGFLLFINSIDNLQVVFDCHNDKWLLMATNQKQVRARF